ncbi:MAG: NACHT domain-containing protein [Methylomarinum sp.]|nr:NACHT domain-containing protein [Methylomarinum sp.]
MQPIPDTQSVNTSEFIDISNNRVLLKYFQNVQMQFMQINNFGLALDDEGEIAKEKPVFLRNLFVAPHLSSRHITPEQVIEEDKKDTSEDYKNITQLLQTEQRLFVLGDPGAGKTTLLNWLMLAFSYSGDNLTKQTLGELVPFVLVLRDLPLGSVTSWDDLWAVFLEQNSKKLTAVFDGESKIVERLLSSGQALLLIDGLDEVTHEDTRQRLGKIVLEGIKRYPRCRMVISSRVIGFEQRQWFGWRIEREALTLPNTMEQDMERVKKHSQQDIDVMRATVQSIEMNWLSVAYIVPSAYFQAKQFISNWYQSHHVQKDGKHNERVGELLERIQQNDGLGRLSRIPVLLNMICFIHARRGRLPDGRAELYQRISETYLISLDTARGLKFKDREELQFDYIDLCEWLGKIALTMQKKRTEDDNAILISEASVVGILLEELEDRGFSKEKAKDEIKFILDYLASRSGLFIPRGKDNNNQEQYAFSHLSFLEYFAARELKVEVEYQGIEYLQSYAEKTLLSWWSETFVLFFEQLENPRLVAKYLELLFSRYKLTDEIDEGVEAQLLLANIVMDSGVRLNSRDRNSYLNDSWDYYLSIKHGWVLGEEYLVAWCGKLWQESFNGISIGVEQARKITQLALSGEAVTDLQPLATLTHLQKLDLTSTKIRDLSPLAGMIKLQELDLSFTPVSDLLGIARLVQIQKLYLNSTRVGDLSKLSGLTKLQILTLSDTKVSDLSILSRLTQLQELYLLNTQVSRLPEFSGLTNLQVLVLNDTYVTELSGIKECIQLRTLALSNTEIIDFSVLSVLRNLERLYLVETQFSDVTVLSELENLYGLNLCGTQVEDLSPLAKLPKLQFLWVDKKLKNNAKCLKQPNLEIRFE